MNELVAKPRKPLWVERINKPINHPTDALYANRISVISQPDIKLKFWTGIHRDDSGTNRVGIGW